MIYYVIYCFLLLKGCNLFNNVNFAQNSEELAKDGDGARHALLKEAEKNSRVILGRLSQGHGCPKSLVLLSIALGAAAAIMSQNLQSWDLKSLSDLLGRR